MARLRPGGIVGGGDEEQARAGGQGGEADIGPVSPLEIGEVIDIGRGFHVLGQIGGEQVRGAEIGAGEGRGRVVEKGEGSVGVGGKGGEGGGGGLVHADEVEAVIGSEGIEQAFHLGAGAGGGGGAVFQVCPC